MSFLNVSGGRLVRCLAGVRGHGVGKFGEHGFPARSRLVGIDAGLRELEEAATRVGFQDDADPGGFGQVFRDIEGEREPVRRVDDEVPADVVDLHAVVEPRTEKRPPTMGSVSMRRISPRSLAKSHVRMRSGTVHASNTAGGGRQVPHQSQCSLTPACLPPRTGTALGRRFRSVRVSIARSRILNRSCAPPTDLDR